MPTEAMVAVDDLASRNYPSNGLRPSRVNFTAWADPDDSDGYAYAAPPGSFRFGEGPYGTLDQAGNVAEWVADEWSPDGYLGLGNSDPLRGPDSGEEVPRITRGGSWRDPAGFGWTMLRPAISRTILGKHRLPHVGFRCAYDR